MSTIRMLTATAMAAGLIAGCAGGPSLPAEAGYGPNPRLPAPRSSLIPVINVADAVGWPAGVLPTPAAGLLVNAFATGLDHPRWLYRLPNGDILVAESNSPPRGDNDGLRAFVARLVMGRAGANAVSANRITLLRDADGDGVAETRTAFLENLYSPFGMTLVGDTLYVANADALVSFPYQEGQTRITAPPTRILALPAGRNHHWTKNVIASPDGRRLYITVGSNSNVGENGMDEEEGRAAVWEYDIATRRHRIFASGLRNPNGLDWNPENGALWTAVNERDEIGNDLVPDYMTSVRDGGFYGWPYSYFGQVVDARVSPPRPDLVARAIRPDYALGAHTASLGLVFYTADAIPQYRNGVLIGQHGSWNRAEPSGYKVVFIPFANGRPSGPPQDVLTGFLDPTGEQARGRPVGVILDRAGAILVADDVGNVIWRVAPARPPASSAGASSG